MKKTLFIFVLCFIFLNAFSQAGISISPGRLYYKLGAGKNSSQFVNITNPTSRELEIGVSFNDWEYESTGTNRIADANSLKTSCVDWIQVLPASFFVLQPGETKEIEIVMKVPETADTQIPVHNGMVFFTQLNPGKTTDQMGAAIQVTVRMGVKVYHSFVQDADSLMEFADFTSYSDQKNNKFIELKIENQGKIWADGVIKWELFNNSTGKKSSLKEIEFYTLPGDLRIFKQQLPATLEKGNYTISAILTYGDDDVIKIAELEFGL